MSFLSLVSACGGSQQATVQEDVLKDNPTFAAISRDVSSEELSSRQSKLTAAGVAGNVSSTDQSFYLAISKNALNQKYFLYTYLRQYVPGQVAAGAAWSVGTRIVTFKVQNDKLFVFDASNAKSTSDSFDPTLVIEAYPIVKNYNPFDRSPSSARYVLFDPSTGINNFSLLTEAFGGGYAIYGAPPLKFTLDLSYLTHFRSIADGVTYDQIFTGQADQPIGDGSGGEYNLFRGSGTLTVSLRKYTEGQGYTAKPLPYTGEYYFRSEPVMIPNGGGVNQTTVHWNIHKGMKPIQWKISPSVYKFASDPAFADIDVYGAVRKGVENWNQAFGFTALEASLASDTVNGGEDDVNYVYFDEDYSYGAAYADSRSNPDTGEIRGANVYFSSLWLLIADLYWPQTEGVKSPMKAPDTSSATNKTVSRLSWGKGNARLCTYPLPQVEKAQLSNAFPTGLADARASLTAAERKQTIESYLTHVVVHEIGHTLGLRHNFKGSLVPPSSSVMEYVDDFDAPSVPTPQAYDVDAIKYLYDLSSSEPTAQKFCTDEDVAYDASCNRFDVSDEPLTKYYGAGYTEAINTILQGQNAAVYVYQLQGMMKFIAVSAPAPYNSGTPAAAYHLVFDPIRPPLAENLRPTGGALADAWTTLFLKSLFPLNGALTSLTPPLAVSNEAVKKLAVQDMRNVLLNTDTIRSFASRRVMVDLLKQAQRNDALAALTDAKVALTDAVKNGNLAGDALNNTQDLLNRVKTALNPYWKN